VPQQHPKDTHDATCDAIAIVTKVNRNAEHSRDAKTVKQNTMKHIKRTEQHAAVKLQANEAFHNSLTKFPFSEVRACPCPRSNFSEKSFSHTSKMLMMLPPAPTRLLAEKFMLLFRLIITVGLHQCTSDVFEQLSLDDIQSCHIKIVEQRRHPSDITAAHNPA
jgi:hypothetical protein